MKISGVYIIRNNSNGRCYVGSSQDTASRLSGHLRKLRTGKHTSKLLQSSWNAKGEEAFSFHVVEEVFVLERLLEREQYWIDKFNAACPKRGFNIYPVAGSPKGIKRSPEQRAALTASRTGKMRCPIAVAKTAVKNRGKKRSDETKAKMSEARKKRVTLMSTREKLSAAMKGRTFSPETIEKMRASRRITMEKKKNRDATHILLL